jgi:HEAT repeat protein
LKWLQDGDLVLLTKTVEHWASIDRDRQALCTGRLLARALQYEDLDDLESEFVRESVAERFLEGNLALEGIATPQLTQVLIDLLSHPNRFVCFWAKGALERAARSRSDLAVLAIEGLIHLLTDPAVSVRAQAASALESVVRDSPRELKPETIDVLVGLLRDLDREVSSRAMYTLERVAVGRPDLAGQLVVGAEGLLADSSAAVRVKAARVLEEVVKASPEAVTSQIVEAVVGLFRDPDRDVRFRAQYILVRVIDSRPDFVLKIAALLDDLMDDAEVEVRVRALRTLEKVVQADAQVATPERVYALARLFQERNYELSLRVGYVLKRMVEIEPELANQAVSLGAGRLLYVSP